VSKPEASKTRYHVIAFHGASGVVVVTTDDTKRATDVSRAYKHAQPEATVFICTEQAEVGPVTDPGASISEPPPPPQGFRQGLPKNPTDG
jgi:hypothetical protein